MPDKPQLYAKAFFDWLPFKQPGDSFSEGEQRITKALVANGTVVKLMHHDESSGSWFEEEYWFNSAGTCSARAQSCSDSLWEGAGPGFEDSRERMPISDLYGVTRILANLKGAAKLMATLPSLERTFGEIAQSD